MNNPRIELKYKKTKIGFIVTAVALISGITIFILLNKKSSPADSLRAENNQTKDNSQDSLRKLEMDKGEQNGTMPETTQSDIQNEKSYAVGIIVDSPAKGDLEKVKSFTDSLKKNIGKIALNTGTENEKNIYYITDPTGAKANFESYYIITRRTDQQIADYISANSTDINAAGSLLLGKDFPQGKIKDRLDQSLKSGKANQFLILNAASPFPADWIAEFQTL